MNQPPGRVSKVGTNRQHRQGDVLLIEIDHQALLPIPMDQAVGWAERAAGMAVLAHGETTGHAHVLMDAEAGALQDAEARYVVVSHDATVVHEEHAPLHIPAATYEVRLQREYAPAAPNLWVDASD